MERYTIRRETIEDGLEFFADIATEESATVEHAIYRANIALDYAFQVLSNQPCNDNVQRRTSDCGRFENVVYYQNGLEYVETVSILRIETV